MENQHVYGARKNIGHELAKSHVDADVIVPYRIQVFPPR